MRQPGEWLQKSGRGRAGVTLPRRDRTGIEGLTHPSLLPSVG